MWMLVIVGVDVYVRLSLEISGWWRADYRKLPLHGPGSHATVTMLHWGWLFRDYRNVVASTCAYKEGQCIDYILQWPSLCVLIRIKHPKVVHPPLTLISRMRQWESGCAVYLWSVPKLSWSGDVHMQPFDSWKCKTCTCWCSVEYHLIDIPIVIDSSSTVCTNAYRH